MSKIGFGVLRTHGFFFLAFNRFADAGVIFFSLWLSAYIATYPWNPHFMILAFAAVVVYNLLAARNSLYESWRIDSTWHETMVIFQAWLFTVAVLIVLAFLLELTGEYFRKVFIIWIVMSIFALVSWRLIIRISLRLARRKGFNIRRVVIVGAGDLGVRLLATIERASWTGLQVVGFFDDKKEQNEIVMGIPVVGDIKQLAAYLKKNDIDHVYIALPLDAVKKITRILTECRTFGAALHVVPDFIVFELLHSRIERLGDMILLNFNPDTRWKRAFDIIFSLFAIIMILPALVIIAFLVKIEDGGPVFYGHRRITAAGNEFKCWKFRTMFVNADKKLAEILARDPAAREEWEKTFKLKNDPRVSRIGKFLRKTSLDELPQFFNVLAGEMSVVGARPIVEKELSDYYKEHGGIYCSMKPGITGPWQVGKRSDTEDYTERIQLDTWYIQNYSFLLDLKIIIKTVTSILHGKGAY